jgi:hypothetical protein
MAGNNKGNADCIPECCEIPICLKIVDVYMTEEAQEKWCALLCSCGEVDDSDKANDD